MKPIDRIKHCRNKARLTMITKELIRKATKYSLKVNAPTKTIGENIDVNKRYYDFRINKEAPGGEGLFFWNGFIPKDAKIVYGSETRPQFDSVAHGGLYYYADDYSYIYDFIRIVKRYKLYDEDDLIVAIDQFIKKKFDKGFEIMNRMAMHQLFFKNEFQYYEPTKEHSIKDFYGKGAAECSEKALIANNLLSVLDFPVTYCMDTEHAFNIIYKLNEKTQQYDSYILDYSNGVGVYDIHLRCIGTYPFFSKIEDCDSKTLREIFHNGKRVTLQDYDIICFNYLLKCMHETTREYGIYHDPNPVTKKKIIVNER